MGNYTTYEEAMAKVKDNGILLQNVDKRIKNYREVAS